MLAQRADDFVSRFLRPDGQGLCKAVYGDE